MTCYLILNGVLDISFIQEQLLGKENIFACDGAYDKVQHCDIQITAILGDLDSLSVDVSNEKIVELADQDYSDFEKAIIYLKQSFAHIIVLGAEGGCQDHNLANITIASKYINGITIEFLAPLQKYFPAKNNISLSDVLGKYISVIPMPTYHIKNTSGLKYPMQDVTLKIPESPSIRNTATKNVVSVQAKGQAMIFISSF